MQKQTRKNTRSTKASLENGTADHPLPRRDDNQRAFDTLRSILKRSEPATNPLALALSRLAALKPGRGRSGDAQ